MANGQRGGHSGRPGATAPPTRVQRERVQRERARRRMLRRRRLLVLSTIGVLVGGVGVLLLVGGGRGMAAIGLKRHGPGRVAPPSSRARTSYLAPPVPLASFYPGATPGEGQWHAAGRLVDGRSAVYETTLRLPDAPTVVAGIAWMDTKLLKARLYSGSLSPGGLFWKYTAPISATAAKTLVAAFAGGFLLKDSMGGYLSEGHLVAPLRQGAASLVIYKDGFATVGQWGRDLTMSPAVVAVRQNLTLLVDHAQPVAGLNPADISTWGYSLNGIVNTWRSGLGVTSDGALVYVAGPMNVVDLARVLVRAGAIRAMVLDMNPNWPVFATYDPAPVGGLASPANGTDLLASMYQSPARFFEPAYSRDFVTMSAP